MWLKNASIYHVPRISQLIGLEENLTAARFLPTGDLQKLSYGFEPVRDDQLVFSSHEHLLLKFTVEKKSIPGSAIAVAVKAKCEALEEEQGFSPGKKQRAEIKERVVDELMPRALASRRSMFVWVDLKAERLIIDSTSNLVIDVILSSLIRYAGLELANLEKWPGRLLGDWLLDDSNLPTDYTIDDAVQLEYPGERRTTIAYKKGNLDGLQARRHVEAGAQVVTMAMTYDSRLSFVMTSAHQLRSIKPLDIILDNQVERDVDRFENDFILMASEVRALIDSLIENA